MPTCARRFTSTALALLVATACSSGPGPVDVAPRVGGAPPGVAVGLLQNEVAQLRAQPVVFDPSASVGTLPGRSGVTPTGQAMYSIPIDVSPGVGSMTPELSFEYRSTTHDGPLGLGFSLGGIAPPIRRCNRTLALDGTTAPFEFQPTDPLCWGDERLVLVAGVHGLDGAEYRTRQDPFAKIVAIGDSLISEGYFQIFTKDGRILTLGQPDAELTHEIDGNDVPWVWALRRAEDRFGNVIDYRYHAPTPAGSTEPYALLLDEIAYAGTGSESSRKRVVLDYEPRTDDPSWGYVAGVLQGRTERLEAIVVEGPHDQRLWSYELSYAPCDPQADPQDSVCDRSQIESIEKCDAAGKCLPPTTFEWSDPGLVPLSMSMVPYSLYLESDATLLDDPVPFASSPTRLVGDFDGDSDHDLLYFTDLGWRAWDGTSQFDLLDTPVTVSWPTVLPEGDAYVEALIEADVDAALIAATVGGEELTPQEQLAIIDEAAARG